MEENVGLLSAKSNGIHISKGFFVALIVGTLAIIATLLGLTLHFALAGSESPLCLSNLPGAINSSVWAENRGKLVRACLQRTQEKGAVILYGATVIETKDGDTEKLFRQSSNFTYLTGAFEPDMVVVISLEAAPKTYIFTSGVSGVWDGEGLSPEQWTASLGVTATFPAQQLDQFLASNFLNQTLFVLESQLIPNKPVPAGWAGGVNTTLLSLALQLARQVKSAAEVALMEEVAKISSAAHTDLMRHVGQYTTEYEAESRYLYSCYNCKLRQQAYTPIFASGYSASILHYTSNENSFEENALLLVDAGGEYRSYGTDITRTYPVSGRWTEVQREIYTAVLAAQQKAKSVCREGASWAEVNKAAYSSVVASLHALGYVTSYNAEDYADVLRMKALFMPHGLGHSVGLDVHDVPLPAILQSGVVLTLEPGIYFNRVTLSNATLEKFKAQIDVPKVRQMLDADFGGVRIEDVFVVEKEQCRSLSNAPRTIQEIQKVM